MTATTALAHQNANNTCYHPNNQYVECCGANYCDGSTLVNDCSTYFYTGTSGYPTGSTNHTFSSNNPGDFHQANAPQCEVCTPNGSCSASTPVCPTTQTFGTDNCGNTCSRTTTCTPTTYSVSGRVHVTGDFSKGIPDVNINGGQPSPLNNGRECNIGTMRTNSSGDYTISGIPRDISYCVRTPTTNPSGFSDPTYTNSPQPYESFTGNKSGANFGYTPVCTNTPTLTNPGSLTCRSTRVRLDWNTQSSATGYNIRVEDNNTGVETRAYWANTDVEIGNSCGPHDVCINNHPNSEIDISVTQGVTYSWWVHAVGGLYCSAPSAGTQFTIPSCTTTISASPSSITKSSTWPAISLTIANNDTTASRVMWCQVNSSPGVDCNSDIGWNLISSSVGSQSWTPPSDYTAGDYYFAVYPSSTPRLAKSGKVIFINPDIFDFSVSSPNDITLVKGSTDPGHTVTVTKTTASTSENVTLSLVGATGGATYTFKDSSGNTSSSCTPDTSCSRNLVFDTSSATAGTYSGLKVRGISTSVPSPGRDSPTFTLTITATAQPNLTVDDLSTIPIVVNNPVSPTATVRNNGTASTGVASTTRLKIDTNKDGTYDSLGTSGDKTGILSAGGNTSYTWSSVWTPTATGTYNYQVCADATGVVAESDESTADNCKSSTISVTSTPVFDYSLTTPANITVTQGGAAGSSSTTITKIGTATSEAVTISLDPTTPLPSGATSSFTNNSCAPNTTCQVTLNITPNNAAAGTYPLKLKGISATTSLVRTTGNFNLIINSSGGPSTPWVQTIDGDVHSNQ